MTLKSNMQYTAKSLEDIAEHFEMCAERAKGTAMANRGRISHLAHGQARAWREAAEILRATHLDPEMQEAEEI